jgi:CubicO group peptidase (beta-lactamase class C family)
MKLQNILFALLFVFAAYSCEKNGDQPDNYDYDSRLYEIPVQSDDGWITASAVSVNIDTTMLHNMVDTVLKTPGHKIHSIVFIKDNRLIFEKYFIGFDYNTMPPQETALQVKYNKETLHYEASVSKSVTSLVLGIAKDKGFISNTDEKISKFFPQYDSLFTGKKADLTLKNLLTMSSGIDFDEDRIPLSNPQNDLIQLFTSDNPIYYILSKQLFFTPGSRFHYCSGNTNLLGEVIKFKTKKNLLQFATENLFHPMDITDFKWENLKGDCYFASGGLWLRTRDLAKLGSLFLNNGKWNDKQIVSESWLQESATSVFNPGYIANGYGYQWWIRENGEMDCIMGNGMGQQLLYIYPSLNIVVAINCGYFNSTTVISPDYLMEKYILPSVKAND